MRVHGLDGVEACRRGEQGMAHPAGDFGLDEHVVAHEVVQTLAHGALERVFQGHDAEIGPVGGDGTEHVADGGLGQKFRRMPQGGHGREMGKGAFRTEIGHAFRALEPTRGGEDFPVDGEEMVGGQGAGIGGGQTREHFLFAEGLEHGAGAAGLAPAHFQAQAGAFVEQMQDLVIHGVDTVSQFEQGLFEGARLDGGVFWCGRAHVNLP